MGGSTQTTSGLANTTIPSWLQPVLSNTASETAFAQQGLPDIAQLYKMIPALNVPGLTGQQTGLISQLVGLAGGGQNMQNAQSQLEQLTGGQIGSSPATQAGMQAYNQLVAPSILQNEALAGRGTGGGATEALAQGATAAAVPLIQQEISNRANAVGQYGGLEALQGSEAQNALSAAGLQQQTSAAQQQAAYNQALQQLQYAQGVQQGPFQLFGNLFGQTQGQKSSGVKF